jgi:hypothetical protein
VAIWEAPGTETVPKSRWSVRCGGYTVLRSVANTRPRRAGERSSVPQAGGVGEGAAAGAGAGSAAAASGVQYRVLAKG